MAMTYLGNYHYAKSGMMHGLQHIVQTNDWHSNRKLLSIVRSNPTRKRQFFHLPFPVRHYL